jgi:hypothetical protein
LTAKTLAAYIRVQPDSTANLSHVVFIAYRTQSKV